MTRRYTRVLITLLQLGWTWVLDPSEIILPRAAFVSSLREVYDQFNSREKERERQSWEIGSKLGRGDEDVVKKRRSKYSNLINKCIWDDSYVGMIRGRRRANNYCYWNPQNDDWKEMFYRNLNWSVRKSLKIPPGKYIEFPIDRGAFSPEILSLSPAEVIVRCIIDPGWNLSSIHGIVCTEGRAEVVFWQISLRT